MVFLQKRKLGLVLGGGASRGVAHIGVVKCLDEERLYPDVVVGTSIGALIGCLYACGWGFGRIADWAREVASSSEFRQLGFEAFAEHKKDFAVRRMGYYLRERLIHARMALAPFVTKRETLRKVIDCFVPDVLIENLPVAFGCTTLDLVNGRDILLRGGPLRDAVMRSISIAGMFPPFEEDGCVLVDAGPTCNVPVDACRELGAEVAVAVNLRSDLARFSAAHSALATTFRADEIARYRLNKIEAQRANVLIEPRLESIHWADFGKIDVGLRAGHAAARAKLSDIRAALRIGPLDRIRSLLPRRSSR
ncbi:MAG: patatin-like phospholipase family protein [Vicinamibacteria bacterium]|nr:patatin-like phospholipase family protein [Vicinamibacteria bacterium]